MSSAARAVAVVAVAFVAVAVLAFWGPLREGRRPVVSTAAPPPKTQVAPIDVQAGQELCAHDVVLTPRSELAELVLNDTARPVPPLEAHASADGYASPPARVVRDSPTARTLTARIRPPDRELYGRFCVRNRGPDVVTLVGTNEFGTQTHARTELDAQPIEPDVALKFSEDRVVTLVGYVPDIVRRMSVFRGWLGAPWLVWVLGVLVVAGVPVGVGFALYRALSADAREI
jgi:hypothetical protein